MRLDFRERSGAGASDLPAAHAARRAPGHGRVLRYPIDAISVAVVVGTVALQVAATLLGLPWYTLVPILLGVRQLHLVEHNHSHLKIFRQPLLNDALGWLCFLSNGFPLECYELHHVQNHHRYTQRYDDAGRDWSSTFGYGGTRFPDQPVGRAWYMATFMALAWMQCLIQILRNPRDALSRRFFRSALVVLAAGGALAWARPGEFLLFFGVPWILVYLVAASNNYDHHQHCRLTTPYDSSNVDLRFPYRGFGFNIGYHVAHHLKPTLHWSLLPRLHGEIEVLIPAENFVPRPRPDSVALAETTCAPPAADEPDQAR